MYRCLTQYEPGDSGGGDIISLVLHDLLGRGRSTIALTHRIPPMIKSISSVLLLSAFVATLPMLLRGDVHNYAVAIGAVLSGALAFVFNARLQGWGHALFHVLLAPFVWALAASATLCDKG